MINKFRNRNIKAFTLIEILIVISIIGLLSAISIFGLRGAREAGRDARRKADLETIRSGIELYRADCGAYPLDSDIVFGDSLSGSCPTSNTYIQIIPNDPLTGYQYDYVPQGVGYTICAGLEGTTTADTRCVSANCGSGVVCSYSVVNP